MNWWGNGPTLLTKNNDRQQTPTNVQCEGKSKSMGMGDEEEEEDFRLWVAACSKYGMCDGWMRWEREQ